MKKQLAIRSFWIMSVLLIFISLCNLFILWWIKVNFLDLYEISPYAYLNLWIMVVGTVLYISRNVWGWMSIVLLLTINVLVIVYKAIIMFGETNCLSLLVLPYALLCGGIVFISTLPLITKCFFSSEEHTRRRLLICGLIIKIFIVVCYFTYIRK